MNIILLSGGSGKRLWPLSNDVRSKQFIKLFADGKGGYESMVQRVYRQVRETDPDARITVATAKSQISSIRNQLGDAVDLCVEPCRRDTFPAIALAAAYLHDIKGHDRNEAVVICPIDPYVDADYFEKLKELYEQAEKGAASLVLMGIRPTYPSAKYGYIIPSGTEDPSPVESFKEKPDEATAEKYIGQGALWNSGVFACRIGYVLDKARDLLGASDYKTLFEGYGSLERISFDYAVVEKELDIRVLRFGGEWKDIGTWNTLSETMDGTAMGNVTLSGTCEDTHVINELDIPILCMGMKKAVIAASPEGILVSDKEESSYIKPYVEKLDSQVMFAEKSWGSFQVLDVGEDSMTIKVTLNPGHRMNYHSHKRRDEVWNVISGKGRTIVDGMEQPVQAGDVVTMQAGCRHTIIADTELKVIEVQLGREISVHDKQKHDLE